MLHAARVEPPSGIRGARLVAEWPPKIEREAQAGSPPAPPMPAKPAAAVRKSERLPPAKAMVGPSAVARGVIVDETGAPVSIGKIRGMGYRHTCSSTRYGIRGAIRNGEFEFRYSPVAPWQVPPGLRPDVKPGDPGTAMSFWVTARGYVHEKLIVGEGAAAALLRGELVRDLTLVLQRGAHVEGVVRGPDGRPVAGISVNVIDDPGARGFEHRCSTDQQGRFRMIELDPRRRLWIRAKSNTRIAPPVPLLPLYATAVTYQSLFAEQVVRPEPNTSVPDGVTTGR